MQLTIILDHIGENEKRWLLECIPYIEKHYNDYLLIECFLKFVDKKESLKNIALIYKEIPPNKLPTHEKENIEKLIDHIYSVDSKSAEAIITNYGQQGQHFLRDIWKKHNKSKN